MQKVADGDLHAFEHLYDRFAPILTHFFVRHGADLTLADDLTQKIFICLWQRRKGYRADSPFEAYLFSIAKHSLSKEIRESRRLGEAGLKWRTELIGDSHDELSEPELELYLKELAAAVERAKARLSIEERQALTLAQDGQIPLRFAAQKLACSQQALKSHLKRARKRMRELLAPILDDERGSTKRRPRHCQS
jgi:RNA polymerase sigma-70 factor (ECF subfamily)